MGKEKVVFAHNGMLFSITNEGSTEEDCDPQGPGWGAGEREVLVTGDVVSGIGGIILGDIVCRVRTS